MVAEFATTFEPCSCECAGVQCLTCCGYHMWENSGMTTERQKSEFPEHMDENRQIWDVNAHWWDDQIGDGNAFQEVLIEPPTERLLEVCPGESVLDVACGAGRFARRLTKLGAKVVGIDYSAKFIERARHRDNAEGVEVDYRVMDACNEEALLSLGVQEFDRAVCPWP